ncbi:MAG TPA: hypothetical protein PKW61_04510 [Tenuifilaceae bacterium]|nr:hypothetical protein [Tenuifilaceae bacterium]
MKTLALIFIIILTILVPVYFILTTISLILKYWNKGVKRETGKKLATISGITLIPIVICLIGLFIVFKITG